MSTNIEMIFCDLESEFQKTRIMLERVPESQFDWQPHEKSWPLIRLATHLANLPSWIGITLQTEGIDITAPFPPNPVPQNTRELVAIFDQKVAGAMAALGAAGDEALNAHWSLLHGDTKVFSRPKYEVIREWAINHMIHHRAQMSIYFRLVGVSLPALYGPSADES